MPPESLSDVWWPVPAKDRGRVLNSTTTIIACAMFLLQALLFVICALAPAIVGGLVATGKLLPKNDWGFTPVLIGMGLSGVLMWLLMGQLLSKRWSSLYVLHKATTEFARRQDRLVDPNNPEAILVEIIPRRNWGTVAQAEDLGFLVVDQPGRQLLFEGDNKRYRIPAQALISCEVELMDQSSQSEVKVPGVTIVFREASAGLLVVKLRDSMGEREIPLRPLQAISGDPLGTNYIDKANELRRRILTIAP